MTDLPVSQSIIDRRLLEQQVAEYEAILRSIGDGLLVTDHENQIVMVNDVAAKMLGWVKTKMVGKFVAEVAPLVQVKNGLIPSLEEVTESVLAVSSVHKEQSITYYLVRRDGTKFPVKITASSIIVDKAVAGTVIVFRDITLEKEIEREKSDFISISSHQLRTPLGSIKWNLEMLTNGEFGPLPDKVQETVGLIMESNQRMIGIVNDLLSVSRIERRQMANNPEQVEVTRVIKSVIEETIMLASSRSITISSQVLMEHSPMVKVDPKLFHEVIENLVTNAIKYNHQGGKVTIYVGVSGNNIRISVADTGEGIPEEEHNRIFTKFFRGDNAIHGDTEGTGLGLFVVKSYVELWGGRVWFESEVGKGTIFYVELPMARN